jgi:hypothetical protein
VIAFAAIFRFEKQGEVSNIRFVVRQEIKRIKAVEPKMTHKEAFSTAAKNVRYCPFASLSKASEYMIWEF